MSRRTKRLAAGGVALLSAGIATAPALAADDGEREAETVLPMGRLVFTSDRGGEDVDLWMYVAGEPEPIQLTSGRGRDRTPALSPDGTVVAFSTDRENLDGFQVRGSNLRYYDLYTVATDGSEPVELVANQATNSGPDWSPDGSMIAYAGHAFEGSEPKLQVFVVPADSSADPVVLTDDPVQAEGPAWSPDGRRLAFSTLRHGQNADDSWNREIYLMNADGSDQLRLTDNAKDSPEHRGVDDFPSWRP